MRTNLGAGCNERARMLWAAETPPAVALVALVDLDVAARHANRRQQRGIAQNATSVRDAALTDLDTWMRDLRIVACVALKDHPQLLEQIGVTG